MTEDSCEYDLSGAGVYRFPGLEQFVELGQRGESRYRLDESRLASPYYPNLPPVVVDLLDIASSLMWADRQCLRPRAVTKTYDSSFRQLRRWVRHFKLTLGVRAPDVWNDPTVKEALEQLLYWLTEDTWELHFVSYPVQRPTDIQTPLWPTPASDALIILYSGGLDSLAGAVSLLEQHPRQEVILLSVISPRLSGTITRQVHLLQYYYPNRVKHAKVLFTVIHNKNREKYEKTERTRGLLFFACGLAQAVAYQTQHVITCENGIGMLNLPFNKRQLGAQHTRSVHPQTLVYLFQLLKLLRFPTLGYEAPFAFQTKGELCSALSRAGLDRLCAMTISCDSFPFHLSRHEQEWHCGRCSSCLLRRQAIFTAHLEQADASVPYRYDVCQQHWAEQQGEKKREELQEPLLMMLDQMTLLTQCCSAPEPHVELLLEFPELSAACSAIQQAPHLFGLAKGTDCMGTLVALFQRYVNEWWWFPYCLS